MANEVEGSLLLLNARKVNHDRIALPADLWFGDTEGVHSAANDVGGLIEGLFGGVAGGLIHHGNAALEIEAEKGFIARDEGGGEESDADDDQRHGSSEL